MQGTMGKGRKVEDMDIVLEGPGWVVGRKSVPVSLIPQLCFNLCDLMWKAGDIKHRVQWEHLIVLSELNRSSAGGRNCLPIQEAQVQSLSWEDLLEEEMATHSNILAWEIPWTEEPDRLQSMELQGLDTT